jgi:hypothetical protein
MSHVNIRFRPRLEEVEPRIVPQGGDWHAIVQAGKALNQAYRQHAHFDTTDPYCNSTDPGPCASWPDLVTLRSELYQLGDQLHAAEIQSLGNYQDAAARLDDLTQRGAPFALVHQARLETNYWDAFHGYVEADSTDVRTSIPHTDDAHLVALADRLFTEDGTSSWVQKLDLEKQAKKAYAQDLNERNFAAADNEQQWLASLGGILDEKEFFITSFLNTVR